MLPFVIFPSGQALLSSAWGGVVRGADVYAFLVGIMALAECARFEGLFDWLAGHALDAARGSQHRLFGLMYLVGIAVTALLSNDTTAVILTPAIAAAMRRTTAAPLPYLFISALVANAASYLLPISNPANLVIFGRALPAMHEWLAYFALSALAALAITYVGLGLLFGASLQAPFSVTAPAPLLPGAARVSGAAILLAALALVTSSALHGDVGVTALVSAALCLAVVSLRDRAVVVYVARHVSWRVLPLVAGLFALVAVLEQAGAIAYVRLFFEHAGPYEAGAAIMLASAIVNNLPVALATGFAFVGMPDAAAAAHGALVAVDLGPNCAVSASLATMLWMRALERDGIRVSALRFAGIGCAITIPALAAALLLVR